MTPAVPISPELHITMFLGVLGSGAAAVLIGAMTKGHEQRTSVSKALGLSILTLWLIYNAYYFLPSNFQWYTSLPLHVCDLLGVMSAVALVKSNRTARALLYFCALPLATQAVLTPIGNQDPATARFWLYWLLHAGILAASLYDLVVERFRPRATDLGRALIADVLYVALIVPLNVITGWNYGYLGQHQPEVATAIDLFGPWPARIGLMLLAVIGLQVLMYLPWGLRPLFLSRRLQGK